MTVRVTIEVRDRQAAEVVARHLGGDARSWRGLGVIRVVARDGAETAGIVAKVSGLLEKHHDLAWVRIRYGDESRIFRSNGRRTA